MRRASYFLLVGCLALSACGSARLAQDEARKKIAEIGQSNLIPDAIEVQRIVSQNETTAIAEASVTLAFQFKRATQSAEWRIEAVRLGDRDWISLDELLAGINEGRRRETTQTMQLLAEGIEKYRSANGSLPVAKDVVALTDALHPRFMKVLVREDGWGQSIIYETTGNAEFKLISHGPDGRRGTPDDVVVDNNRSPAP